MDGNPGIAILRLQTHGLRSSEAWRRASISARSAFTTRMARMICMY